MGVSKRNWNRFDFFLKNPKPKSQECEEQILEIEQKLHQNLESDTRSGFGTNEDPSSL
jgi:hypothetical protein